MLAMFSRFTRFPARRCLHTAPATARIGQSYSRLVKFAIGTSAVTATYLAWRLTSDSQRIALDSSTPMQPKKPFTDLSPFSSEQSITEAKPSESTESDLAPDSASSFTPLPSSPLEPTEVTEVTAETESEESEQGSSAGAFNPVTGEINWDCPCLGGMAHGPCGPEFREAFSCFVYSEEEPKGINCVEKFKNMQTCFRAHPEVYKDEIDDDDDDNESQDENQHLPDTQPSAVSEATSSASSTENAASAEKSP